MPNFMLQTVWSDALLSSAAVPPRWIWHGYLATGCITILTSQWKSGKTTLLSLLLSKRLQGGPLAGLAVEPGKTVVVSEEDPALWSRRRQTLDFGGQVAFCFRPFPAKPSAAEWRALLENLKELCRQQAIDLVAIDTLASFMPFGAENNADLLLDTLMSLLSLAKLPSAVLLLHHPRKGDPPEGQAARGTGALLGFADIVLEMKRLATPSAADRRRKLAGLSRFAETPRQRLLQLNEAGTDYACLSEDFDDSDFAGNWQHLQALLAHAKDKLTRAQIREEWSPDVPRPAEQTLWRWLDRAHEQGLVARDGGGFRASPFRYWLPHKLAEWMQDPIYELFHMGEQADG